jgi:voltage-gated sodium channel
MADAAGASDRRDANGQQKNRRGQRGHPSSSLYGSPTFHKVNLNFNHIFPIPEKRNPSVEHDVHPRIIAKEKAEARHLSTLEEISLTSRMEEPFQEEEQNSDRRKTTEHLRATHRQSSSEGSFQVQKKDDISGKLNTDADSSLGEEEWKLGMPVPGRDGAIGKFRNFLGAVVNSGPVSVFIILLITVNAIVLGALTFPLSYESMVALDKLDMILLYIFTAEFASQLLYLGLSYFQSGWFIFDGLITVLSWAFVSSENQALRSFRVFRVYTIISRWTPLRNLARAVGLIVPRLGVIATFLGIFFYTFCVVYTALYMDLYDEGYLDYDYFGRLDRTFLTLFQLMTLDSWTGMVRQVVDARPWAWLGFCAFVVLTAFFVLNLVVAVICESLIELRQIERKQYSKDIMRQNEEMMSSQTEMLLRETRQVARLQQEMLHNQLQIQRSLKALVESLCEQPTSTSTSRDVSGLRKLRGQLKEVYEGEGKDAGVGSILIRGPPGSERSAET